MAADRERVLSEFIDAWNAGAEPDVDHYLERVAVSDRDELADRIADWIEIAPVPAYDAATTARLLAAPAATEWLGSLAQETGLLPRLLARARAHARLSVAELGQRFVRETGVAAAGEAKATAYLERLERGELPPAGVTQRALDALGRLLGIPGGDLRAAATPPPAAAAAGGALYRAAAPAPASAAAPKALEKELEAFADAALAPSPERWDEVDELFRGGRA